MESFFGQLLFSALGWSYLKVKYRKKEKIRTVLAKEHNNNYYDVGAYIGLKTFGIVFLSLIALLILVAIYSAFKFGFK